ncbi:hypothetical protein [Nocardiopsis baichengensis]|uniref:hypothetical protein n=1 Tax=Nocardiopsis baichengensis TaxID=280240 RepID=UPI001EF9CBD5|nr:hypothetical protein [Nocardiopsis baichengensis]
MDGNDFYEEDEPLEEVLDAFERGEKHVTEPPALGFNAHLSLCNRPTVGETGTVQGSNVVEVC